MINRKELAICKRRGHGVNSPGRYWEQCKHCGMWLREKRTIEERESAPPEDEQDRLVLVGRLLKEAREESSKPAKKAKKAGK